MSVFVLGSTKLPLMPCSEKRARKLLTVKRAIIHRLYPFTIRLKDRVTGNLQPVRVKLDPGSKQTGIAVAREEEVVDETTGEVKRRLHTLALLQLNHRGTAISEALKSRAAHRRQRRARFTRYREARFNNRPKSKGWLAPSLMHRVHTCIAWVRKIRSVCPITSIAQELVRFDMQKLESPDIEGAQYQQGELAGFEVREYLLNKWNRACAYCGAKNQSLQIEHIHPKSKGGTDKVSNLTLACQPCNQAKGVQSIETFLVKKPEMLKKILAQAKRPLKDAAAVNSTRWRLYNELTTTRIPVQVGTGGQTKWNRIRLGIPKEHALDAACVGHVDELLNWKAPTLMVKCVGRGRYGRTLVDKHGFPRAYLLKKKQVFGFQTGDMVKATVPKGKYQGEWRGRIAVRASGSFSLNCEGAVLGGVSYRHLSLVQKADGYGYGWSKPSLNLDDGPVFVDKRQLNYLYREVKEKDKLITSVIEAQCLSQNDCVEELDDLIGQGLNHVPKLMTVKPHHVKVTHISPHLCKVGIF